VEIWSASGEPQICGGFVVCENGKAISGNTLIKSLKKTSRSSILSTSWLLLLIQMAVRNTVFSTNFDGRKD
jgi:hypothetical protein